MQRPRLRDNKNKKLYELYPLGQIPDEIIIGIGKWIAYRYTVGQSDIDGEDWGDIFAQAIGGEHLSAPLGLADVVYEGMAWSVKSVKNNNPHNAGRIRVISGRCSPDFSYGISDPRADVVATGAAVLGVYNERINVAKEYYEPLRTCLLVRNMNTLEFALFEHDTVRYNPNEYEWRVNKAGNFEGFETATNKHKFTWQPHGSQFTIIYDVSARSKKFTLQRPPVLDFEQTMQHVGFAPNWVTII